MSQEKIEIVVCCQCGHQQPGPEDGFDACEECGGTDFEPLPEDDGRTE